MMGNMIYSNKYSNNLLSIIDRESVSWRLNHFVAVEVSSSSTSSSIAADNIMYEPYQIQYNFWLMGK